MPQLAFNTNTESMPSRLLNHAAQRLQPNKVILRRDCGVEVHVLQN